MALCLCEEVSFPVRVGAAENKTKAETEAAQALFNGQRMEKWELCSQMNSSHSWQEGFDLKEWRHREEEWSQRWGAVHSSLPGEGQGLLRERSATLFCPFLVPYFQFRCPAGKCVVACNETLDGLRVRFIAILIPAGCIWFLFFPSYSFLSYFQTLWLRDLYWLLLKVGVGEF